MSHSYEFDPKNIDMAAHAYPRTLSKDVYSGDFSIRLAQKKEQVVFRKGTSELIPIFFYSSGVDTALRRGLRHIRATEKQAYGIWVLTRGAIRITTSQGSRTIKGQSIVITDSSAPFFAEALVDDSRLNEHYLAVIPAHIFHMYVSGVPNLNGTTFPAIGFNGRIIADVISLLFEDDNVDPTSSCDLLKSALRAIARIFQHEITSASRRHTIREVRLKNIYSFIKLELADADFSLTRVATRCKISERYLCQLMRDNGESFAKAVRRLRLTAAMSGSAIETNDSSRSPKSGN
jgi:AraC-like DNA-binding protein